VLRAGYDDRSCRSQGASLWLRSEPALGGERRLAPGVECAGGDGGRAPKCGLEERQARRPARAVAVVEAAAAAAAAAAVEVSCWAMDSEGQGWCCRRVWAGACGSDSGQGMRAAYWMRTSAGAGAGWRGWGAVSEETEEDGEPVRPAPWFDVSDASGVKTIACDLRFDHVALWAGFSRSERAGPARGRRMERGDSELAWTCRRVCRLFPHQKMLFTTEGPEGSLR
jgi:hypothetical protein